MSKLIKLVVACVALGFAFTVNAENAATVQQPDVAKAPVVKAKKVKKAKKAKKAKKTTGVTKADDIKASADSTSDVIPPVDAT